MAQPQIVPFQLSPFVLGCHRACCQGQKRGSFGQRDVNTAMVATEFPTRPPAAVIAGFRPAGRGTLPTTGFVRKNSLQTAWSAHLIPASRLHRLLLRHARLPPAILRGAL